MQRLIIIGALSVTLQAAACGGEPACHGGCGDDHGSSDGGESGSDETGAEEDLPTDLCNCLLVRCHVSFHDRWGTEDGAAIMACKEEVGGLPEAGMDVDSGNFIECRVHYCEMSENTDPEADDPDLCPQAMGQMVCQ